MKLPRDVDARQLIKALARIGYSETRQSGSHIRLTCESPERHSVTRKTRARALANAREVPKPSRNELRDDSELAKLVEARRCERRIKVTLDEL